MTIRVFLLVVIWSECITFADEDVLKLREVAMPGVIIHKTMAPLDVGPVGEDFPGSVPAKFIQKAWDINVLETEGAQKLKNWEQENVCADKNEISTSFTEQDFGASLLARAQHMFSARGLEEELEEFLDSGVSNPDAGPRRMHWVGIEIKPNHSLALHSHPNIEIAYIVEGAMHEWRLTDPTVEKKRVYVPEAIEVDGQHEPTFKYHGPNLSKVDGEHTFQHNIISEGEMFINTIGDVHQSFTKEEGVKLFVLWGDGNADVPANELPYNSNFLNNQSAQAWT